MVKVYLDTSALIKRYIEEEGTEIVDWLFERASPDLTLVISLWNLSESMVAVDKYRRRGAISDGELRGLVRQLIVEIRGYWERGLLRIVPLPPDLLVETWRYILDQHIYAGDAIQIVTCVRERCDFLVAADQRLVEVCRRLGIECFNPELAEDRQKMMEQLSC